MDFAFNFLTVCKRVLNGIAIPLQLVLQCALSCFALCILGIAIALQ